MHELYIIVLVICVLIIFPSCTWDASLYEDLTEKGGRLNPCKNIEAIVFEDGRQCHTESECPEFKNAFTYKMCPRDYPQCFEDRICRQRVDCSPNEIRCAKGEDEFECINPGNSKTCGAKEDDCVKEKRGVDCSADIVKKDGEKAYDCISTVDGYECKMVQCEEGYHYNSTERTCVKTDIHNCASIGNDCTKIEGFSSNENNVECSENHVCIAKNECADGYYLDGAKCLKYTKIVCGKERKDCTTITGWEDGECRDGKCVITKCRDGFEFNNAECHLIVNNNCAEEEMCDGDCVNFESDNLHCGNCSTQCHEKQVCYEGKCVCISGYDTCQSDDEMKCVSINTPEHCGKCNNSCQYREMICVEGDCLCDNELKLCDNIGCVNVLSDNNHCGNCNYQCATDDHGIGMCNKGVCEMTCIGDTHVYVDLDNNKTLCEEDSNNNCGSHGQKCGFLYACKKGECTFLGI